MHKWVYKKYEPSLDSYLSSKWRAKTITIEVDDLEDALYAQTYLIKIIESLVEQIPYVAVTQFPRILRKAGCYQVLLNYLYSWEKPE
jgi:hypothetical protein